MSNSTSCPGFRAHTINPNRCRRCFKDLTDHYPTIEKTIINKSNVKETTSTLSGENSKWLILCVCVYDSINSAVYW